jgi:hypothetical protein
MVQNWHWFGLDCNRTARSQNDSTTWKPEPALTRWQMPTRNAWPCPGPGGRTVVPRPVSGLPGQPTVRLPTRSTDSGTWTAVTGHRGGSAPESWSSTTHRTSRFTPAMACAAGAPGRRGMVVVEAVAQPLFTDAGQQSLTTNRAPRF